MSQADELMKYKELLDNGAITQDEFDAAKVKILGGSNPVKQESLDNYNQNFQENMTQNAYSNNGIEYKQAYTSANSDNNATFKQRKGMKNAGIVCVVFAAIYLVLGVASEISMAGISIFFGILAFMFFMLSRIPKTYKSIGRNDSGMNKNLFVIICVIVAFFITSVVVRNTDSGVNIETSKSEDSASDKAGTKEDTVKEPTV